MLWVRVRARVRVRVSVHARVSVSATFSASARVCVTTRARVSAIISVRASFSRDRRTGPSSSNADSPWPRLGVRGDNIGARVAGRILVQG